jgi:hypothetical protein
MKSFVPTGDLGVTPGERDVDQVRHFEDGERLADQLDGA